MTMLEKMAEAMCAISAPPSREPLRLFVPPCHYARGEDWVRATYGVGPDVIIVESQPLPEGGA